MKKLHILKTLLDVFFIFSIIGLIGMAIMLPMILLDSEGIPVKIKGHEITAVDLPSKLLLVVLSAGTVVFIYAIYLFRKTIGYFSKRDIFNPEVIRLFNNIGRCLVISALMINVSLFFYEMIQRRKMGIEFGTGGFDSLILSISLGLFFMVLSEVFKIAKNLKEENELTV